MHIFEDKTLTSTGGPMFESKKFDEEYKNMRHRHLLELKMLLTRHSQIRDFTRIQHRINMSFCSNAIQQAIIIKMHVSEMGEIHAIENEERWRMSQRQKEEIEAYKSPAS